MKSSPWSVFSFFFLVFIVSQTQVPHVKAQSLSVLPSTYHLLMNGGECGGYPLQHGRWGKPEEILILPEKNDGEGYYYKDIQKSFPDVNWQTLERLYIPAGNYSFIFIENLPIRSAHNPLVITNYGGQVKVGGYGHYYLFAIKGGKNWILTGRFDPVSETGDVNYPGHWCGAYANSRDTYGILIDDNFVRPSVSGLGIGGRATDFEVEFIEIRQVGFAGMTVKTDDDGTATMSNVRIHDTYIHDTLSEGYYIGSTQAQPQHQIKNLELYNNRVIRAGTEAIQVGQLGGNVRIHHNVFALSATHWKDAFQPYQDGNLQIGLRTGDLSVDNNIFIGAGGNIAFSASQMVDGDIHPTASTIHFASNYFSSSRSLFFYLRNDENPAKNRHQIPGLRYLFSNNYFTHWDFQRQEIQAGAQEPQEMIRTFTPAPVSFLSNTWDVDNNFSNPLPTGNGSNNNYSGSGNVKATPPQLQFPGNGLADDFDYLKLEVWSATASRGGDDPITYELNDIAMHLGIPYRCKHAICAAGLIPADNPLVWEELPYFPDDWRLGKDTPLHGLGLLY